MGKNCLVGFSAGSRYNFVVIISRYYKNVYVNSFFPDIASRFCSFLSIKCFHLDYNLNCLKPIIYRHLISLRSSWVSLPICASAMLIFLFSGNSKPCSHFSVLDLVDSNNKTIFIETFRQITDNVIHRRFLLIDHDVLSHFNFP